MPSFIEPLRILAGVEPSTDRPNTTTQHYTFTKGIRFKEGFPEKVGGWQSLDLNDGDSIEGAARTIFSYEDDRTERYLIGTHSRLYDLFGTAATNITPLQTTAIAVANALDNYHATLGNDPISTTSGSTTVTFTDTAHKFQAGDVVTISGATTTNGVPNTELNSDHFIRSVTANTYSIIVNTVATSTGSGGGAAVVRASGYITITDASHGQQDGDRVKVNDATDVGGILAAEINLEFEIRNVTTNTFDIYTQGTSTSSVTGGGGASTTYQQQIDAGRIDAVGGIGYGVGLYGAGLYGVSGTSTGTFPPRVWSHDRFGNLTISTTGEQGDVYEWDADISTAPVKVANSVPANYIFVSDSILVILGYDNALGQEAGNGITWSDQGDRTNFSTGQSGSDVIEGAGTFVSQANARGENLLFTDNQTWTFRYIGGELIWQTVLLDPSIGIIAQNARVSTNGNIYWMGIDNFYMWRGGNVEVIPSNSSAECTALNYVFNDFNYTQRQKTFCWYNTEFREVWWHYPSSASDEPDRIIRVNIDTFEWTIDELDRSAAEYPVAITRNPLLIADIDNNNTLYLHENGVNDDGNGLDWSLDSPFIFGGDNLVTLNSYIPDYTLTGTITATVELKEYPLAGVLKSITVSLDNTSTSDKIQLDAAGRFTQYRLSGNELDQEFRLGQWYQRVSRNAPIA